jgi:drug/metabolite transporter superfamily protein YnfA
VEATLTLSASSRTTAGVILLTVLAVEWGGLTVLRLVRGRRPATEFQRTFARAGHGHAGVFVLLALVSQILVDATQLTGIAELLARYGAAGAAVLFPAGCVVRLERNEAAAVLARSSTATPSLPRSAPAFRALA